MPQDARRPPTEANDARVALVRRYLDGWERGDPAIFDEVLAPDFFDVMYGRRREREELIQQAQGEEFTDRTITIDEAVADGNTVVVRTTGRFTHVASGRRVTVSGTIWVRIEHGRIATGWGEHDRLGQLQQLGVIPSGPAAQAWLKERMPVAAGPDQTGTT